MTTQPKHIAGLLIFAISLFLFAGCEKDNGGEDNNGPKFYDNITISTPTTWKASDSPHTIRGTLTVSGATLIIEPGTIIRLEAGARIEVRQSTGAIIAEGTPDLGIVFTSALSSPEPGDWETINISGTNIPSSFAHCLIQFGGKNPGRGMINIDNGRAAINHSIMAYSGNYEVRIDNAGGFDAFYSNTLTSTNGDAMLIRGRLVHSLGSNNALVAPPNHGIRVSGMAANRIDIEESVLWKAQGGPYIIEDPIRIKDFATLTIEAGARLEFLPGKELIVGYLTGGKLVAQGTEDAPIVFTSASPSPLKGDWRGIRFSRLAMPESILDHCIVAYGGGSVNKGNVSIEPVGENNPIIRNSQLRDSDHYGIYLKKYSGQWGSPMLSNNLFLNNTLGELGQDN